MADTSITSGARSTIDEGNALWGPYWADKDTAVVMYADTNGQPSMARTTDAGANWSTTDLASEDAIVLACWFDKETPGDTGTLVHCVWGDIIGQNIRYITVDVSDATLGTPRTVDSSVTLSGTTSENRIGITKTVNDNLLIALSTQTEIECYKSTDNFATAPTDIADVFETATQEDWVLLFPADVDDGDACALFWDRSGNDVTLKMYDDSANSWTETSIDGGTDDAIHINMDGAVRHSDSHVLIAFHNNDDSNTDDLQTYDLTVDSIASPTVTAKTNVFTNEGESAQCAVFINQQNDDVYISWLSGGTWEATVDVVYKKSTDDMGTWGTEAAYSETTDDYRRVHTGRTVGNDGGRYQPVFYDDDDTEIFVNLVNDIEIAAVVVGTRRIFIT